MIRAFLVACLLLPLPWLTPAAFASPPTPGSEDYDQLMPYADWISVRAANHGGLCCSVSDCRVVKWRADGGGYQAFIAETDDRGYTKFPGAPNAWINVPNEVIKREINPTGRAIACWSAVHSDDGGYYCFFLPDLS